MVARRRERGLVLPEHCHSRRGRSSSSSRRIGRRHGQDSVRARVGWGRVIIGSELGAEIRVRIGVPEKRVLHFLVARLLVSELVAVLEGIWELDSNEAIFSEGGGGFEHDGEIT